MKNLITKEHVNQIQFYQMPKAFFHQSKYTSMRSESKLAYMLMLDLLPLSIQNNWVNENNQVFVKISRTKLMMLLNIKGTQKAAQVMKELVDYGLIFSKKAGLNKCNEIYLYPLEDSAPKRSGAPASKVDDIKNSALTGEESLDCELDQIQDLLENQLDVEELEQRYDHEFGDEIVSNICEMYMSPSTRVGRQEKPMATVRSAISKLKMYHIEHVIDGFKEAAVRAEILSPKRYIQTMLYNAVYEANTKMMGHISHNFGY